MTDSNSDRLTQIHSDLKAIAEAQRKQLEEIKATHKDMDKRLEKLDNRLFKMSANSSAFFGVGIALLSAVIAYIVATVSQKGL